MASVAINVHEVTRVEGHGNIVVRAKDGTVEECQLEIIESPRFFEAMVRGRKYTDINFITSRICGICAVGHCTTSLQATERAMGVTPSEQTQKLRKLNFYGEQLQSHILHEYFLVAPDFFKAGSVIPLAASHPDVVKRALKLKKLANEMCCVIGGRHVMPVSLVVGGFTRVPTKKEIMDLRARLQEAGPDIDETVKLFGTLRMPDFKRETEYISLTHPKEYAFIEGDIKASRMGVVKPMDYQKVVREKIVKHSSSKHSYSNRDQVPGDNRHVREELAEADDRSLPVPPHALAAEERTPLESYMVGALARFNNNHKQLHPKAKKVAAALKLQAPCHNPFMINAAQIVETVHCYEESLSLLSQLTSNPLKDEPIDVRPRAGRGVGACEVPRGILFHDYTYDESGTMAAANLIIPTGQNLANIEQDIRAIVPEIIDRPQDDVRLMLEMLVRAYDPCISCSVHMLDVKFV
jgi:coenzyme F420-reducing hydrogenase alpha subunit